MTRRMKMADYRFIGNADRFDTRIPVRLMDRRFETDISGNAYVVAQMFVGTAIHPVDVTFTLDQALDAELIERR